MESKRQFNIESPTVFLFSVFYIVAGVGLLIVLALSDFGIFTVGFLGILSLLTAYGLYKMKRWSVWLVAALFLPEITFGISTTNALVVTRAISFSTANSLLGLGMIIYIILCFVSLAYIVAKRSIFH